MGAASFGRLAQHCGAFAGCFDVSDANCPHDSCGTGLVYCRKSSIHSGRQFQANGRSESISRFHDLSRGFSGLWMLCLT